jgi:hypothetical protein
MNRELSIAFGYALRFSGQIEVNYVIAKGVSPRKMTLWFDRQLPSNSGICNLHGAPAFSFGLPLAADHFTLLTW